MTGADVRKSLSQNIKHFREVRRLSQADLAYKANISIPFLSDIERGNKWPHPDTLASIATALQEETATQAAVRMHPNAEEGLTAFLEKRKPQFK